ncbi:MAG: preprotein translocase subunit YajC [Oscillospiraceae bacterium]|nr:preprotein translocase subunit YajC [Oscillospiraceae bacterium]
MNIINYLNTAFLLTPAPADGAPPAGGGIFSLLFPLVLMVGVIYFLLIKPQSKRQKTEKNMRDNLQIADEVVTVGGIIGRVLSIKDDTVLIETGGDRTRIRVLKSAIAENRTVHDN